MQTKLNAQINDLVKGFVAGEMTSTDATSEVYDSVMNYNEEDGAKLYDAWEPFEEWSDDEFAGAMSNMHSSATRLVQDAIAALTVDELLEQIRLRENKGRIGKAILVWSREDVEHIAKDMGETLTENEMDDILSRIKNNHDAEYGVTWETIRFGVEQAIEERGSK